MNMKKQIVRGAGVVLLAAFLIAGTPAFATGLGRATSGSQSSLPSTRSVGSYTQNIWSISNQFGDGHTWLVHAQSGPSVFHLSFSSLNGETLDETVSPDQIAAVYGAGSLKISKLANGHKVLRVFVKPGTCESDPANIAAVTGTTASIEVDAQGNPVDSSQMRAFSVAQEALACRTVR